jgi:LPS sulfotransferase NodH
MKTNLKKKTMARSPRSLPSLANAFGDAVSRRACLLESRDLCARARRKTGLEDFGEPAIDPALTVLVSSLEGEANLHPLGRLLMSIHLNGILEARLKLARQLDACAREPADPPAAPPIFITGMPRSGSTFLHELLVQDPALRAPCVWEVMAPADAAQPDRGWYDLRAWRAAWNLWWFRRLAPQADAVYPVRARTPQECVAIQSYTLLSEEFVSTCHVPAYEAFLRSADLRPAYLWQKRFLQFLHCNRPAARWVLKSPDHVRGLEALFSVFPDALVIQTHRNPLDSLRSSIQLIEVLHGLYERPQTREWLAERESHNLAWGVDRLMQFRGEHPELAKRFADVSYSDLAADPLRVVRRIYSQFEMPLTANTIERMRRLAGGRSAYRGRQTAPTLAEVGLDPLAQLKRFSEYCRIFGLSGASAGGNGGQR